MSSWNTLAITAHHHRGRQREQNEDLQDCNFKPLELRKEKSLLEIFPERNLLPKSSHLELKKTRNNAQPLSFNFNKPHLEQLSSIQLYWHGYPSVIFLSQGRWRRLMELNSPSCPSQITTKHLISIPTLSLPYCAPLLCINNVLIMREKGERGKPERRGRKRRQEGGKKKGACGRRSRGS